ncbi:glycosyltransferase [Syntrophotalea carbinolica DSM 2380]|uniref:Glycosyltransferase n=1 Tax=Syntrophotalea carbinolica (strain DSM 2380 / NBRC 103641 / GraBd1) TaxID=338963 RepID=Q3A263_SYNC1|nr:glycosyltransferase family 1 protein [Syntrophotalea carbinolica]ABA89544.1 glycosyltransferase [Syntrophotalea carbinolica DSM 2380]
MSLRVTLISETYMPQINGVSRTLERLVAHCLQRGDQLQLMVPDYNVESEDPQGVERRSWRGLRLPFYKEICLPLVAARRLRRALQDFAPHVVHIATEGPLGWTALRVCRQLGLPVVSSYHTNFPQYLDSYRLGWLEAVAWRYLRWFHNATSATLCPTSTTRDMLVQRGFERVGVWGRGVDPRLFDTARRSVSVRRELGIGDNEVVAVYTGRLAAEKNLPLLMEAWRHRPADGPDRLLLIGDGPLRSNLEAKAPAGVVFAGYRWGEDLARCYAAGDLFVFPSITDTFGNVMLEAMASGLPVIGFDVAGPRDVIRHGETGLVIQDQTAGALAAAMARMTIMTQQRQHMSRMARSYAETQSWPHILEQVREQYRDVVPRVHSGKGRSGYEGQNPEH